jgi:hypothetical protein
MGKRTEGLIRKEEKEDNCCQGMAFSLNRTFCLSVYDAGSEEAKHFYVSFAAKPHFSLFVLFVLHLHWNETDFSIKTYKQMNLMVETFTTLVYILGNFLSNI